MSSWPAPDPTAEREHLRAESVEQLMRMSADEDLLLGLLADPSPAAAATVGQILVALRPQLMTGCPLLAYGAGRPLDHAWRRWYPPVEASLFAELRFYRSLTGADPTHPVAEFPDAYAELEELRDTVGLGGGDLF